MDENVLATSTVTDKIAVFDCPVKDATAKVNEFVNSLQAKEEALVSGDATVEISNVKVMQGERFVIQYTVTVTEAEADPATPVMKALRSSAPVEIKEEPVENTDETCLVNIEYDNESAVVEVKSSTSGKVYVPYEAIHEVATPGLTKYYLPVDTYTVTVDGVVSTFEVVAQDLVTDVKTVDLTVTTSEAE